MPYRLVKLRVDIRVRKLCIEPYYNHPRGCPNYNKKKGCPPSSLVISRILNLNKPTYIIWNRFNFFAHCRRMKRLHPQWSDRQIECCLYWQGTARKNLRKEIDRFKQKHSGYLILECPESHGVNVTETMRRIGIKLEWPPMIAAFQVAIAGERKPRCRLKRKRT